jgi:DNA-nicking Smr family endonuclease
VGRHKSRRGGRRAPDEHQDHQGDRAGTRPPEIFLRKCTWEEAMHRLSHQVASYARQGRPEVIVVHGKGHGSPDGHGVLGDAVRAWCLDHPDLVRDWRVAPPRWGGAGAVVLQLNV